jgi:GNAT superfamily N-acetyltransferase
VTADHSSWAIRERTAGDLDRSVAALRLVFEHDGYPGRWPADPAGWLTPRGVLRVWVAECAGSVIGHVAVRAAESTLGGARIAAALGVETSALAMVARLLVVPAARGAGIGRALLDTAADAAARRGRRPALDVDIRATPAVALYRRAGWQSVGTAVERHPDGTPFTLELFVGPDRSRP